MSVQKVKAHLMANFLGRGGMSLLALLATPFYVRLLGIEWYGLIGFYVALTGFFYLFDFGLGDTLCREAARLFTQEGELQRARNTLRTLETFYWLIGALLSLALFFSAPWICDKWLNVPASLTPERLASLIRLMGLSLIFLWPFLFYCKGLQGLQAHFLLNTLFLLSALVKYGGSVALLLLAPPTPENFFYWQIVSSAFQTVLALVFTWKKMGLFKERGHFSFSLLAPLWKFSLGMSGIGVTSIALMHMDRLLVAKLFSFKVLGLYACASTLASSLYYVLQPIMAVYYPLLIQKKGKSPLSRIYTQGSQLVALVVFPIALVLIFFGKQILILWSGQLEVIEQGPPLLALLTGGILLSCMLHMPFYLQIANGWTRLSLAFNGISVLLMIPIFLVLNHIGGFFGAASFYIFLHAAYIFCIIPIAHRRYLPGENGTWYRQSILIPLFSGLAAAFPCFFFFKEHYTPLGCVWSLLFSYAAIALSTAFGTRLSRDWLLQRSSHMPLKIGKR